MDALEDEEFLTQEKILQVIEKGLEIIGQSKEVIKDRDDVEIVNFVKIDEFLKRKII